MPIDKITVVKEVSFDAAHRLPAHKGKCYNMHGHTYRLQIGITGEIDKDTGMVVDFAVLKQAIEHNILKTLDHQCLNDIQTMNFPYKCPTAENMVIWIRDTLNSRRVSFIRLYETPTSYAEWKL